MLLLIHIFAALSGIVMSTYSFLSPTLKKIRLSYGLVLATIVSGTIIIIKDHVSLLSVCLSGLLYVGCTVSGLVAAKHRLAKQASKID